ncbi:MAG: tRNA lysidine(34) synthetase TilS [Saprospiraceae bacterium]|nr:tRNA lysidine(34) synthetase TilS [Saprospiraceae bacterium]
MTVAVKYATVDYFYKPFGRFSEAKPSQTKVIMQTHLFIQQFRRYIEKQGLFTLLEDRILLAVSGGIDSVVMAQLCWAAGVDFGIAHCNFNLRAKESDQDAEFVAQLAEELDAPFYIRSFDTEKFAKQHNLSIQKAARLLRYEWFESIRQAEAYDYIATAHHINDSIESILMNLTNGCGIKGLRGIAPKQEQLHVVRPLGFLSKTDIQEYAQTENIAYREDSSNHSTKYTRNKVRHLIIPQLKALNPSLETTFYQNIQHFQEAVYLYNEALNSWKERVCTKQGEELHIEIAPLQSYPARYTLLFELLNPYGFNRTQIYQIIEALAGGAGALYHSSNYTLLRDRTHLIVAPRSAYTFESIEIFDLSQQTVEIGQFKFSLEQKMYMPNQDFKLSKDSRCAHVDLAKLKFPLRFRMWKSGDYFYPMGMHGARKKVSKLFKDLKLNLLEKSKTVIIESDQDIVWVTPHRLDERFKINLQEETKVLSIKMDFV